DLVRQSGARDEAGHPPHDRTRLILHQHAAAGRAHLGAAAQAVLPHAGQDDRQNAGAVDARDRTEQHVDRGPAGMLGPPLPERRADGAIARRSDRSAGSPPPAAGTSALIFGSRSSRTRASAGATPPSPLGLVT